MAAPEQGSDNQAALRRRLQINFTAGNNNIPNSTTLSTSSSAPSLANLGHRTQIERLHVRSLQSTGKLRFSPDCTYNFSSDDLEDLGEIGRGNYGAVYKMVHKETNKIMAVKRIRSTVDEGEQKQLLMDLDVVMRSNDCPCIVQFYGALFKEGDCWICMELMDISLDRFYKFCYGPLLSSIPEEILGRITLACWKLIYWNMDNPTTIHENPKFETNLKTLTALNYLKEHLKIIHRDIKPSNILLDRKGNIKLCDFGISGQLVDSIARSRDAGCRPYMAPERIDPRASNRGYDVRSDVWSLGITLLEVATGKFPYPKWNSVFDQLTQVVQGPAPQLKSTDSFSSDFTSFLNTCLTKDEKQRPKYNKLLEHPFIKQYSEQEVNVSTYVCNVLDQLDETTHFFDQPSSSS